MSADQHDELMSGPVPGRSRWWRFGNKADGAGPGADRFDADPAGGRTFTGSASGEPGFWGALRPATMAGRLALLTTAVAAVAVLIAGAVSYGLVRNAAEAEARKSLASQADVVAEGGVRGYGRGSTVRLLRTLSRQGITVVGTGQVGQFTGPQNPAAITAAGRYAAAMSRGEQVSAATIVDGETYLVEGRPLVNGGSVLLVQRRADSRALGRQLVGRTVLALIIGLAVAALAGWWLARRFTSPLRRTAAAAHTLASGERHVRVPEDGPAEVAEVAASLNALAAALEASEGRQRDFLLSVSHELRTPLTAVKGFAESLADGVTTGDDVTVVGGTMLAEADRLDRLVSDLLDLARLGAQDFRIDLAEVDLTELVDAAAEVWWSRCEPLGVRFAVELPPGPVPVRTDPTRVRQILDGLAENALRVTPAGQPIVFRVGTAAGWGVLEVSDGGPGLTEADCAVAFERSVLYERYRGVRRVGTGVGLALVHGLTTRLGGHAVAGRAPEGGARFTVWLPVATGSVTTAPESSAERVTAQLPTSLDARAPALPPSA
jgi:two-component system sensor histidine kinase BaeS